MKASLLIMYASIGDYYCNVNIFTTKNFFGPWHQIRWKTSTSYLLKFYSFSWKYNKPLRYDIGRKINLFTFVIEEFPYWSWWSSTDQIYYMLCHTACPKNTPHSQVFLNCKNYNYGWLYDELKKSKNAVRHGSCIFWVDNCFKGVSVRAGHIPITLILFSLYQKSLPIALVNPSTPNFVAE